MTSPLKKLANPPTAFGELLMAELDAKSLKLHAWTAIEDMPEGEPWNSIKELYRSPKLRDRATACLINGCHTSRKIEFLLSVSIMSDYLREDPNISRTSNLNGQENLELMEHLLASGATHILRCLKGWKRNGRGSGKDEAGTYRLVHPAIVSTFDWLSSTDVSTHVPTDMPTTVYVYGMERTVSVIEDVGVNGNVNVDVSAFVDVDGLTNTNPTSALRPDIQQQAQIKADLAINHSVFPRNFDQWLGCNADEWLENVSHDEVVKKFENFLSRGAR